MQIAIQGVKGSFHHEAAMELYGSDIEIVECKSFDEVFAFAEEHPDSLGIVAIENSLQGSINQTYRLLAKTHLQIVDELYLKVGQYLISAVGVSISYFNSEQTKVYSMYPAFAQVEGWLESNLPLAERVEYYDTAAAVQKVVQDGLNSELAIAGKFASETYGGKIVAGPINDNVSNYTRFFVVAMKVYESDKHNKTSIILTTDHKPGALYRALGVFEENNVSLLKLSSYPIPGDKWHYMFYVDFNAGLQEKVTKKVLHELEAIGVSVKILGTYEGRDQ